MSQEIDLISETAALKKIIEEHRIRIEKLEEERQLYITNRCMTLEDVAREAGCSVQKIRKAFNKGMLPARYPCAKRKFHVSEVNTFLRGMRPRLPKGSKRK